MNNQKTVYPPSVEEKLQYIVETSKELYLGVELREECVRDEFGPMLMKNWISGDDDNDKVLDADEVYDLFRRAAANSLINNMIDKGLIDSIDGDGTEMIFVTQKGKEAFDITSADINQII